MPQAHHSDGILYGRMCSDDNDWSIRAKALSNPDGICKVRLRRIKIAEDQVNCPTQRMFKLLNRRGTPPVKRYAALVTKVLRDEAIYRMCGIEDQKFVLWGTTGAL
ncbi:MAG: hypothetical protein IPK19_04225 [Chloroflexi bacterium]|nr:hypothetical protein [Chloroflexota bacterium]